MLYIIVNSLQNDLISYYHSFNFFLLSRLLWSAAVAVAFFISLQFSLDDDNSYVFFFYLQRIWHFNNDGVSCSFKANDWGLQVFQSFVWLVFFFVFNHFACACVFRVFFVYHFLLSNGEFKPLNNWNVFFLFIRLLILLFDQFIIILCLFQLSFCL